MSKSKAVADDYLTSFQATILDSSKLKELADDNFKFDENKEFSKRIDNTDGRGEIACYKQSLHFTKCLQRTFRSTTDNQKPGLVWERVK